MPTSTAHPNGLHAGTSARILYVNANGETSERTIDVQRTFTSRYGIDYVRAYCHLRGEDRTFRCDRILAVLDQKPRTRGDSGTSPAVGPVAAATCARATAGSPGPARPAPACSGPVGRTEPAPVPQCTNSPRRSGRSVRLLLVAGLAVAGSAIAWHNSEQTARMVPSPEPVPASVVPVPEPPRPAPDPAPSPQTNRVVSYRGHEIRISDTGTSTASLPTGETFLSAQEARVTINRRLWKGGTWIETPEVLALFSGADANHDGEVSWREVRTFQLMLDRRYSYQPNGTALRPDEFLREGGGDCEDWALVTACMLRFWGIPAYVASLQSGDSFHAVTFVPTDNPPPGAVPITIAPSSGMRSGRYVPVDYKQVGSLSNAVAGPYKVRSLWIPDEILGWTI